MKKMLPILILIVLVFILDLTTPLGVADGILYVIPVMLVCRTGNCRHLVLTAAACMVLVILAVPFHSHTEIPWVALTNRSISELAIFIAAYLMFHQMRTETALHFGEQRYRSLVTAAASVVWTSSGDGRSVDPQPSWTAYTGQPWEKHKDLGWAEMIHPEDRARAKERWAEAVAKQGEYELEARIWHQPSERYHHTHLHAVPVKNGEGAVREWIGMIVDTDLRKNLETALDEYRATLETRVAERTAEFIRANRELQEEIQMRKTAEKGLRDSEEKYRALMDNASDAILLATPEGRLFEANKRALDLFGYTREEMIRLHFTDIRPAGYRDQSVFNFKIVLDTGYLRVPDSEILRKDGTKIPVEMTASLIELSGQKIAQGIFRDTTERKQSEETLRNLKNAIEQAAEGMIITNAEGIIEYVNPAIEKTSGYSWVELVGESPRLFKSGRHGLEFYRKLWTDIKAGKTWHGEMVNKRKNGDLYEEEMTISPIYGDHGKITHFVGIKRAVTEEKLLRQQLLHSEKLSAIGTFVSGVAHELNNPLTSIIGFSRLLQKEEGVSPAMHEKLGILTTQAGRAANIVKNLLKFSKPQKPHKVTANLNGLVEEMVALNAYSLSGEKVRLVRQYREPSPHVLVDGAQVQQVFVNIIMNATSAMKEAHGGGTLTIITGLTGNTATVFFENTGPPIPENMLDKIFEPFMSSKGPGGTGLGLYISRGIIAENGGKVWAENLGTAGVRFVVTFPAAAPQQAELPPAGPAPVENLRGLRILYAEDEEAIRQWLASILFAEGVFVQFARDGEEAVRLLDESDYDMILSNVKMPNMDGFEFGEWLKRARPQYTGKFVLTTGHIDGRVEEFCSRFGCGYLLKPFEKEDLLAVIARIAAAPREQAVPAPPASRQGLSGLRVLFAEDEEAIRQWIGSVLIAEGMIVEEARDGAEAMRLLEKADYDVILSNCNMPNMDGIQLGEWISRHRPGELRKLMFATGHIDGRAERFCSLHRCQVVLKPYEKEELLRAITNLAGTTPT
ncbi:MAG: PAS domain S-box protein [Nitrospinae bacterium]|nr:PAS domain S-box protein [Nitrospinota bacterium]